MGELVRPGLTDLAALLDLSTLTPEELDEILRQEPGTVRRWRDSGERIPKAQVEALSYFRRAWEYDAKVKALALPVCPTNESLWAVVNAYPVEEAPSRESSRAFDAMQKHVTECPMCRSNQERIAREVGPNAWRGDRSLDMRLFEGIVGWARRPWTLALSLPALIASAYAALAVAGSDANASLWRAAYVFLGGFFLKLAYPALRSLWRRTRDLP